MIAAVPAAQFDRPKPNCKFHPEPNLNSACSHSVKLDLTARNTLSIKIFTLARACSAGCRLANGPSETGERGVHGPRGLRQAVHGGKAGIAPALIRGQTAPISDPTAA
jgi:hypothetical protein